MKAAAIAIALSMVAQATFADEGLVPGDYVCKYSEVCTVEQNCQDTDRILTVTATHFLSCITTPYAEFVTCDLDGPFARSYFEDQDGEIFFAGVAPRITDNSERRISMINIQALKSRSKLVQSLTIDDDGQSQYLEIDPVPLSIVQYRGTCVKGRCKSEYVDGALVPDCTVVE